MKNYNLLVTILLALNLVSCGVGQKEKEGFFSFDENSMKPMYQANEKFEINLLNQKNKTIDSIIYFANERKVSAVKGNNKFTLDLAGKKLGQRRSALVAPMSWGKDCLSDGAGLEAGRRRLRGKLAPLL